MVWYTHLLKNFPQFIVIHTGKGFGTVNKAEIDIFLELSSFFHDPADVGNLISGSSERSYPMSEVRAAARRSYPTSKEQWLGGRRRAKRSYSTFKVRRGGGEEIHLIQNKEQQLRSAGVAVKRYPTSKVRETQIRR